MNEQRRMPGKIVDFLTKDCHIDFFIKEARKCYSKRNVKEIWLLAVSSCFHCLTFFRQLVRIKTNVVNSGHWPVNAKKIQSTWWSIAPKVAESVQVCMILKKWNRLPITFKNFVIIDLCNAFFSLFLVLTFWFCWQFIYTNRHSLTFQS